MYRAPVLMGIPSDLKRLNPPCSALPIENLSALSQIRASHRSSLSMHQSGVSDPEQDWINKYRAAIADSEPATANLQEDGLSRGYLIGITIGTSESL